LNVTGLLGNMFNVMTGLDDLPLNIGRNVTVMLF
jgi:hypothetical protein